MLKPNWKTLQLDAGVLREPTPESQRLVVWLAGACTDGVQHWDRAANVPGTEFSAAPGVIAAAATLIRAQQRKRSIIGNLLARFQRSPLEQEWLLPNGARAVQAGARETHFLLVWAPPGAQLDESGLQSLWPTASRRQRIGANLFLVGGVVSAIADTESSPPPRDGPIPEQSEQLLKAARAAGDQRREVMALTDLGIARLESRDPAQALALLESALDIARRRKDPTAEIDVLNYLAVAVLGVGQPVRARELFDHAVHVSRACGDRFAEKRTLELLGGYFAHLRDPASALAAYQQACALAAETGDRTHQAELLWRQAIQHGELANPEEAMKLAEAAHELFRELGHPSLGQLADALQHYRRGEALHAPEHDSKHSGFRRAGNSFAHWSFGSAAPVDDQTVTSGPSLLRKALSSAKALGKFLGSGAKTVPKAVRQHRLATCVNCEHHTGQRCRLCGCFTSVKTWLPHESCPIAKWTNDT